jgi:hypothetical protein
MAPTAPRRLLGKLPPREDPRTLKLAKYLPKLPPTPAEYDWSKSVRGGYPMLLNDQIGDCAVVSKLQLFRTWRAASIRQDLRFSNAQALAAYRAISGYDPADPSTDRGCVMLDTLKWFRNVGVAGHKLGAFASVTPANQPLMQLGLYLFGGLDLGFALPETAADQDVWDVVPNAGAAGAPGSWGGHAVGAVSFGRRGITVVTWGAKKLVTWPFVRAYADEAYAVLSTDFLASSGKAPNGFDLRALQADLAALR